MAKKKNKKVTEILNELTKQEPSDNWKQRAKQLYIAVQKNPKLKDKLSPKDLLLLIRLEQESYHPSPNKEHVNIFERALKEHPEKLSPEQLNEKLKKMTGKTYKDYIKEQAKMKEQAQKEFEKIKPKWYRNLRKIDQASNKLQVAASTGARLSEEQVKQMQEYLKSVARKSKQAPTGSTASTKPASKTAPTNQAPVQNVKNKFNWRKGLKYTGIGAGGLLTALLLVNALKKRRKSDKE